MAELNRKPFRKGGEREKNEEVRKDPRNKEYGMDGERLYKRNNKERDLPPRKLCISEDEIQAVLRENHTRPTAGHLGVFKTMTKFRERYLKY